MTVREGNLEPIGHQQIVGLVAATSLTIPTGARYAILKTEAQAVRWRDDGVDPTAAIGMLLDVGDEFFYTGKLSRMRLIQAAATATLDVAYYK